MTRFAKQYNYRLFSDAPRDDGVVVYRLVVWALIVESRCDKQGEPLPGERFSASDRRVVRGVHRAGDKEALLEQCFRTMAPSLMPGGELSWSDKTSFTITHDSDEGVAA